jgi:hypothetical protein
MKQKTMILLKKLASALCLVLLFSNYSNSQVVDPATGSTLESTSNILNLGGGLPWTNTVTGAAGGGSGGETPAYNPSTGNIIFGFVENTVSQSVAINTALAGTGVQLMGFKYSWDINNDLSNWNGNRGTLIGNVSLTGPSNNILAQYDYNYSQTNTGGGFQNFSGTQLFTNQYQLSAVDKLTVSFTGKDQNWWAGYYGPRVHVNDVSLLYKTDPCATNPAYSVTCAGFSKVLNTNNLLDSTQGGSYLNQAFAVNTALQNAGVGAMVHGFNYGFNWRVGQSFSGCTATNQDGSCSWYMNIPAYANASVSLTNKNNQIIHQQNYSFSGDGTSGSVSEKLLFPTSLNQSILGMGRITGSASGTGSSIEGAWATMIYTADPCANNPLYSPDCKGYATAIAKSLAPPPTEGTTSSVAPTSEPPPGSPPPPPPGSSPPPGSPPPPNSDGSAPPPPPGDRSGPAQAGAPTNSAPTASNSQPKAGEVSVAGAPAKSTSGPSMSMIMSILNTESNRVSNVEKSSVTAAVAEAQVAGAQATQQAETVAGSLTSQSIAASLTSAGGTGLPSAMITNQSQSNSFSLSNQTQSLALNATALRLLAQSSTTESVSASDSTSNNAVSYSLITPDRFTTETVMPQTEGSKFGERSVLNDSIESRALLEQSVQEQSTVAVNKNAQSNELAGGVDINKIATQPKGYDAYAQMTLSDAAFYKVDSIYKNQRTVDNARVLRGLTSGSDRLHQELVDQQYKLGK